MRATRSIRAGYAALSLFVPLVAGCAGLSVSLPGGLVIGLNTIHLRLTNTTAYDVDPRIFGDDDDDTFLDSNIVTSENYVATGLVPAGSTTTIPLSCDRRGTIKSDTAMLLLPGGFGVPSVNDPKVTEEDDFDCGDTIDFIFIDDGFEFRTRVEVNGRHVAG
jgi:hypothetical protein